MSDPFDFSQVGGVRLFRATDDVHDPDAGVWNFGLVPSDEASMSQADPDGDTSPPIMDCMSGMPAPDLQEFHNAAPALAGRWDGKTSISLWQATLKVDKGKLGGVGTFLPAQNQPRGTCVGRGASGAGNVLQCVQVVAGTKQSEFRPLSHAWLYAGARKRANMLRSWSDGAVGAYAALWAQEKGLLTQPEAKDENYYGPGSDDLAVKWGYYGPPAELEPEASDNPFQEVAYCKSFQQFADTIASGGVVTVASDQGFTMTRDANGACRPSGTWMHQMFGAGVLVIGGRKYGLIGQSWGNNVPSGPPPAGCPDYVFAVDESTLDSMLRQGDSCSVGAIKGWGMPNIDPFVF